MAEFNEQEGATGEWEQYVSAVATWRETRITIPGAFAVTNADSMWDQQKNIPFPSSSAVPTLRLPLRFHLARGPEFGCRLTEDQLRCELVPDMNRYWAQAGIQWDLVDVLPAEWANDADGSRRSLEKARQDMQQLVRDPETGKMTNKGIRRKLFLEQLIPEATSNTNTYDVYLFDFIGEGSQGCCISRESHTVIMGNRSTKGYPVLTERSVHCLAKTCAHELGHALDLDHPKGQVFADGTPHTAVYGNKNNLMTGISIIIWLLRRNGEGMQPVISFLDSRLTWRYEPSSWHCPVGSSDDTEGYGGAVTVSDGGDELRLSAPAKKDFWSKTFYSPLLIRSDASALLCSIEDDVEVTVKTDFQFEPKSQFDQGGLLVYVDEAHWVKCGIEYCDGSPRLSVVVCNDYSDWSTQPWATTAVSLKIHKVKQSDSIVVEAAPLGTDHYQFIRIAHLAVNADTSKGRLPWRVGPYAACPIRQSGCETVFRNFSIGPREASTHSAEL